jgi:hypothetical protein
MVSVLYSCCQIVFYAERTPGLPQIREFLFGSFIGGPWENFSRKAFKREFVKREKE